MEEIQNELTLKDRLNRIWMAITNPMNPSPLSPEGYIGIIDLWWATQMFFVGFAKSNPEQAGKCFFYTVVAVKVILLLHFFGWIF